MPPIHSLVTQWRATTVTTAVAARQSPGTSSSPTPHQTQLGFKVLCVREKATVE
jgi:hypothetical protein